MDFLLLPTTSWTLPSGIVYALFLMEAPNETLIAEWSPSLVGMKMTSGATEALCIARDLLKDDDYIEYKRGIQKFVDHVCNTVHLSLSTHPSFTGAAAILRVTHLTRHRKREYVTSILVQRGPASSLGQAPIPTILFFFCQSCTMSQTPQAHQQGLPHSA